MFGARLFSQLILLSLFIISNAQAVVRFRKTDFTLYEFLLYPNMYAGQDPPVTAGAGPSRLVVDPGTDPTNPATLDKVYVPMWQYNTAGVIPPLVPGGTPLPGGTLVDNARASILANIPCSGADTVPSYSCSGFPYLAVDIYNDEPSVTRYVYVVRKDLTGTWTMVPLAESLNNGVASAYTINNNGNGFLINSGITNSKVFYISLKDAHTGLNTAWVKGTNYTGFETRTTFYIFAAISKTLASGDPTANPGGTYVEVNVSDRIPINPATQVSPGNLYAVSLTGPPIKGDTQATVAYNSSTTNITAGAFKTVGIATTSPFTGGTYRQGLTGDTITGLTSTSIVPSLVSGAVKVSKLTNGTTYYLSVGQMNKYQFISEFPPSNSSVTPEEIPGFIRTQGCFLLSAGFKKPHYVLSYFTGFRDNVLKRYVWGRSFIDWYYQTAPKYAMDVYNSSVLSWTVRTLSYMLYGMMNYFKEILATVLVVGSGMVLYRRRRS